MIRNATIDDAERLLEIYAYYVKNTAITLEYDVPSLEEFGNRIDGTLKKHLQIQSVVQYDLDGKDYRRTY